MFIPWMNSNQLMKLVITRVLKKHPPCLGVEGYKGQHLSDKLHGQLFWPQYIMKQGRVIPKPDK